ncbi:extracellular solute-binding protein [Oricola sp.]|uniref:extracellular solute-binding protein n=1 Tax=Oricola sp. TaxID=1979950 RepID=UPI003BAC555A
MKLKTLMLATAASVAFAGPVVSDDLPACDNCADELTVVSWGGAYQNSQIKAYSEPYAEKTGVKFIWDESSNEAVAKLRAMNEAGNITWDLVDVEGPDAVRLCDEGLAAEVDINTMAPGDDGSSPADDFGSSLVSECFIPQIVFSTTFGYRTNVDAWGGATPSSLCDIFDTEKFPGKRALEKRPKKNIEWALVCDGVAMGDLYDVMETDEGIDRALAKLGSIKDDVIWWSAGADTPQLLADGEIVMGSTYNGRLFSVIEEQKQPVAMLWDYQVFDFDGWIIPEGLPEDRLNRVMHFLHFATDTQRLADQAKYISYGPARASSAPLVGKHAELGIDMGPHMPTDPANMGNIIVNNIEWWSSYADDVDAKFQAWLAK